ncbi:hypothetical protein F4805DRAFT_449311 [Annulohypoxylon moriforme]|nr:hypothetical protein F4805DRAFT_449311 [Annulohypoxylon moriforme]
MMSGRPKFKEYAAVDDEETACLSEVDSTESFLGVNQRRVKHPSIWIPRVRCNAAGSILGVACIVVTILVTIQCTIWYERRGSNAPRWRPAFCRFLRFPP